MQHLFGLRLAMISGSRLAMSKILITLGMLLALLSGCSNGGDSSFGKQPAAPASGGATTVATVTVQTSAVQIAADGTTSATITAVARDSTNNFVSGATATFSATAGGLAITQATTDANGAAIATLSSAGAAAGTNIVVTATIGGVSSNVTVAVVNTQQTISVITSIPQIPSDRSKSATITALVRGANNQFLSNVPVNFVATSGGLTVTQAVTDSKGAAIATLDSAGDPTNRRITVTATAGSAVATIAVDVIGTKLTLTGLSNLVQGSQSSYTFSLTDYGNVGIPGKAVTLASALGNTLSTTSAITDAAGQGAFQLTATVPGSDTLTASGLGLQAQQAVAISNQSFVFSAPANNVKIPIGGGATSVTVTWTSGGVAQAGQTITFSATRGTLSALSAVTNASGQATVTISSTTSGPAIITASAAAVAAQLTVDFIATNPTTVALQASPATIPTQGQSTITAVVRDAQNNLVEGKTVNFQLNDITGGTLSLASAVTNNQGRAQTVYGASSATSASNGVTVTATIPGTAVPPGTTTLTVGGQTVFLSLGTGNTINILNNAQYSMDYAIQAIDAAGNALDNVPVTIAVHSLSYIKGRRVYNLVASFWDTPTTPLCTSEDSNDNGILDVITPTDEDFNTNGKLDPGNVASVAPGSVVTANGGSAIVQVVYPKDHAFWVNVRIIATATVQGTQASTSADLLLPGATKEFNDVSVLPPGIVSPYGTAATCSNPN